MIVLNDDFWCVSGSTAGPMIEHSARTLRNMETNLQSEIWKCPGGVQ